MLVLSRRLKESIGIDGNLRITVAAIRGNQVRLAIEAPDAVKVYREELLAGAEATGGIEETPGSRMRIIFGRTPGASPASGALKSTDRGGTVPPMGRALT